MHMRLISLHIQQDQVDAFKQASLINCMQTVKELGVTSFAFLQQTDKPTHFIVLEVYRNEEARLAHFQTEWFRTWREAITPMLTEPLDSYPFHPLFPPEEDWE